MIAVIDYNMGNIQSVLNALTLLGEKPVVTREKKIIGESRAIILPGVGAFGDGMKNLQKLNLITTLDSEIIQKQKPFLGICLGMQLLATGSTEHGSHNGLGWIPSQVELLSPPNNEFKVPHMGWNNIKISNNNNLFKDIEDDPVYYFVHSYHLRPDRKYRDFVSSTAYHGEDIVASIEYKNIFATQFHPEKSQGAGLKLLENFINISNSHA